MAYSLEDEVYLALYAGWEHAADDAEYDPDGRFYPWMGRVDD